MFEGFTDERVDVGGAVLRVRSGGTGRPVLLVHGHPRTSATWHKVAPLLVEHGYQVTCPDLRGYGQSSKPPTAPDHSPYSKRAMAADLVALMRSFGHERFAVVGHDRGCYVAQRLALDHPSAVTHLAVLDGVPIAEALDRCDARFATAWWHWFFFAQPDVPERVINADPVAWYRADRTELREQMGAGAYAEFLEAITTPATVHAMVEDYRAGLGVDRTADEADRSAGRTIRCPTLVGWARHDDMETLYGDIVPIWRNWADDVRGAGFDSGHHLAEEVPEELTASLLELLDEPPVGATS